jgi:NAD(P)-dependent dehydrogenase (short-subunit alcohol dehydrogenase family)
MSAQLSSTNAASYPSLRGRRVFITGGGSGIGAAFTEGFAKQGATVAFVDVADGPSQALVEKIEKAGAPRPWYRNVDVRDVRALQSAIADAAQAVGDFYVLINNVANDDRHNFMDVTPEYYDGRIAVNQRPAFFAIQVAVPSSTSAATRTARKVATSRRTPRPRAPSLDSRGVSRPNSVNIESALMCSRRAGS